MSVYNDVKSATDCLEVGQMAAIPIPTKLPAFRKFLTEISRKDHKKFTTKVIGDTLHILRIKYYSVTEKINNE